MLFEPLAWYTTGHRGNWYEWRADLLEEPGARAPEQYEYYNMLYSSAFSNRSLDDR